MVRSDVTALIYTHHDTPWMIGRMIAPFGAMMSLSLGQSSENYVFR
jgi:hypothetical protein